MLAYTLMPYKWKNVRKSIYRENKKKRKYLINEFSLKCTIVSVAQFALAKKESRLKFYRMSFALHSIDICIKYITKIWKQMKSKR